MLLEHCVIILYVYIRRLASTTSTFSVISPDCLLQVVFFQPEQ